MNRPAPTARQQTVRAPLLSSLLLTCIALSMPASAGPWSGAWDGRFYLSGVNGPVHAILVSGQDVYVGGKFTAVGGLAVNNIAKWNGVTWSTLGSGTSDTVEALAISAGQLYVAGAFTNAGGINANRVARWDGATWTNLGSGILGKSVYALAVTTGGMLYAGGEFSAAGGSGATNIARWDGAHWTSLGNGVNATDTAYVLTLALRGNDLYVGGTFTEADTIAANNIAKWNGVTWSALGNGVDDAVYLPIVAALVITNNLVYAAGSFDTAGNASANNIACWNGTAWSALGTGLQRYYGDLPASALLLAGDRLFVGGRFVSAGSSTGQNLAVWNGASWADTGLGVNGTVNALAAGTNLFVGGSFVFGAGLNNFAQYDGVTWSAPGTPGQGILGSSVAAAAIQGSNIFAGGTFADAGGVLAGNIARWDGGQWRALGTGVNGDVYALCASGNDLFVGGSFNSAGASVVNHIARWDGVMWHPLSTGVGGPVYAMVSRSNLLFVGGSFVSAGGLIASNIACWNGQAWSVLGSGLGGTVRALAVSSNVLFAGGSFKTAGGVAATNIARWDGSDWHPLAAGLNGAPNPAVRIRPPPVSALAVRGNDLYVAGDFALAGSTPATNIARWDGTNWFALGPGLLSFRGLTPPPTISCLLICGKCLYAGGTFSKVGAMDIGNLARWDGTSWTTLAGATASSITGPAVLALAAAGSTLCVGGSFQSTGPQPASHFCLWSVPPELLLRRIADQVQFSWPAKLDGYGPETSPDLRSLNWTEVTNEPTTEDDTNHLLLHIDAGARFFRLNPR